MKINTAFWRDVRFLKWAGQIAFLFLLFNIVSNFISQAIDNLNATNLPFSWRFLGTTPGVLISEGFVTYPESGLQALQVGMANMLRITLSGIFVATILGTVIGVARLSKNWVVQRSSTGLVETNQKYSFVGTNLFLAS
jgi:ABC-type amino acid transport system, permease component